MARITIVDDDQDIRQLLSTYLTKGGFEVTTHESGEDLLARGLQSAELLILDVGLQGIDGLELCRQLRRTTDLPIIMLTAANDDVDRILGLELGADDYIGKPFNPRELLARIKALLRRSKFTDDLQLAADRLVVDALRRTVFYGENEISLTGAEFELLVLLYENLGQIVSRDMLNKEIKGKTASPFDRSIDTLVSRLRSKLASELGYDPIKSIRGKGYQLVLQ